MFTASPKNRAGETAAASSFELILTQTVTLSVASLDFTGIDDSFTSYKIIFSCLLPSDDFVTSSIRTSPDGITFDSGAEDYVYEKSEAGNSFNEPGGSAIIMANNMGQGDSITRGISGEIVLHNPSVAANRGTLTFRGTYFTFSNNQMESVSGGGSRKNIEVVAGIRLFFATGTIDGGTASLYGIK